MWGKAFATSSLPRSAEAANPLESRGVPYTLSRLQRRILVCWCSCSRCMILYLFSLQSVIDRLDMTSVAVAASGLPNL